MTAGLPFWRGEIPWRHPGGKRRHTRVTSVGEDRRSVVLPGLLRRARMWFVAVGRRERRPACDVRQWCAAVYREPTLFAATMPTCVLFLLRRWPMPLAASLWYSASKRR